MKKNYYEDHAIEAREAILYELETYEKAIFEITKVLDQFLDLNVDRFLIIEEENLMELQKKINFYGVAKKDENRYEKILEKFFYIKRQIFYTHMKF